MSFLSSFRAQRSGDPEQGGLREQEAVADTDTCTIVREQIASGAASFRVSAALRPE